MEAINSIFDNYGSGDYIGEPVSQIEHMLQCAHFAREHFPEEREVQIACLLHDVGHLLGLRALAAAKTGVAAAATMEWGGAKDESEIAQQTPRVKSLLDGIVHQAWEGRSAVTSEEAAAQDTEILVELMEDVGVAGHERLAQLFCNCIGLPPLVGMLAREHVNAKRYLCAYDASYFSRLSPASVTTLGYQGGVMHVDEAKAYERRYNVNLMDVKGGAEPFDFETTHGWTSIGCAGSAAPAGILEGPRPGTVLEAIVRMRRMDELGKCKGLQVGGMDEWGSVVEGLVAASRSG